MSGQSETAEGGIVKLSWGKMKSSRVVLVATPDALDETLHSEAIELPCNLAGGEVREVSPGRRDA